MDWGRSYADLLRRARFWWAGMRFQRARRRVVVELRVRMPGIEQMSDAEIEALAVRLSRVSGNVSDAVPGYDWLWQSADRHSGDVCFRGTRVPLDTAEAYRRHGRHGGEFLDDFPSVSREQAEAAWELSEAEMRRLIALGDRQRTS